MNLADTIKVYAEIEAREFSQKSRKKLAKSGDALPDGSFPIANKSDLENARRAVGRAKNPGAARAHIRERAKALHVKLGSNWAGKDVDAFRPMGPGATGTGVNSTPTPAPGAKMTAKKAKKVDAAEGISNPSYFGPNTDMGPSRSLDPA